MRTLSVGMIKNTTNQKHINAYPKEDTVLDKVLKFFKPGEFMQVTNLPVPYKTFRVAIISLNDFYGMDIRNIKYGTWCLVGEYINGVYVDYL